MFLLYSNLEKYLNTEQHGTPLSSPSTSDFNSPTLYHNINLTSSGTIVNETPLLSTSTFSTPLRNSTPLISSDSSFSHSNILIDSEEFYLSETNSKKRFFNENGVDYPELCFEYMKGELEYYNVNNVDDIQLTDVDSKLFSPALVILYETKLLFLPVNNHYNNDSLNITNSNTTNHCTINPNSQLQSHHYTSTDNIIDLYNSNNNNNNASNNNINNNNCINTHELIHYGKFQSIDLYYSQIYSVSTKQSNELVKNNNENIEGGENFFIFKIVYLYQNNKLENYYFKVKDEEEFSKWCFNIQKNIQFSLHQKKILFEKTNFIFLSSNYTYYSTLKQMRRSFRCYENPPFVFPFI